MTHALLAAFGTLGDAPATPMVWSEIEPEGSDYAAAQGHRYAALASASLNYTLEQITGYLGGHGWQVTYAWQQGQASRGQFSIDAWLAALPADTTDNHRWVYIEANRTGPDVTLGVDAPWPLTIYHVAHVFEAVPGSAPPALPSSSSSSSNSKTGEVVGGVAIAASVLLLARLAWKLWA